jgi:acetyltransferase-like isoleucine patch superfamily enzyme
MVNLLRNAWLRFEDPLTLLLRARNRLYSLWLCKTYPFASTGRKLSVHYPFALRRRTARHIRLGSSIIIGKDSHLYIVPDGANEVKIVIGDNCAIGARSTISAKNCIHIEQNVMMATSVLIQDHHHTHEGIDLPIRDQGVTPGGRIRIEQGCWIGQGAAIVCNEGEITIGRNSVLGSNSVVGRSVPPYSVVVGNPGIVVRRLDSTKTRVGGEAGSAMTPRSTGDTGKKDEDEALLESRN